MATSGIPTREAVTQAARYIVAVNGNHRLSSSGVIWRNGIVVTADHTLRRDDDLSVVLPDGKTTAARLAGRDPSTDLAVLHVATGDSPAAELAGPASLEIGAMVLAVGRRGENGPHASLGVISALGGAWRTWRGGQLNKFIRSDAALYPGSSGSALVDLEGKLIGINTAALTRGWSVTIAPDTVNAVLDALLTKGHVARGFLGVGLHPVRLPDGKEGLIFLSVETGGPAATAGLLLGDVLLSLDGQAITSVEGLQLYLGPERVGKTVEALIVRGGATMKVPVVVGARPK